MKDMLLNDTFSTRYFTVVSKLYVQFKSPYKVYPILWNLHHSNKSFDRRERDFVARFAFFYGPVAKSRWLFLWKGNGTNIIELSSTSYIVLYYYYHENCLHFPVASKQWFWLFCWPSTKPDTTRWLKHCYIDSIFKISEKLFKINT